MEKKTTFRLEQQLLDLLNKDAVKADISLSEQIRNIIVIHYHNNGEAIKMPVTLSDKKIKKAVGQKLNVAAIVAAHKPKEKVRLITNFGKT